MTRKHYVELAKIISAAKTRESLSYTTAFEIIQYFETELADLCARSNPRFDRSRFKKACEKGD